MNKIVKTKYKFHLKQHSMSIFILPLNSSHSLKCCQLRSTFWRFLVKLLSSSDESYSNRNSIFVGQTMNPTNMTKTPSSSSNLIFLCTQCNFASQTIMAVGHNDSQLGHVQQAIQIIHQTSKVCRSEVWWIIWIACWTWPWRRSLSVTKSFTLSSQIKKRVE